MSTDSRVLLALHENLFAEIADHPAFLNFWTASAPEQSFRRLLIIRQLQQDDQSQTTVWTPSLQAILQ